MKTTIYKYLVFTLTISLLSISISAQRRGRSKPPPKPKTIVFAVLDDGKMIEPIGVIDKGELTGLQTTDANGKVLVDIHKTYYKPKTRYNLVFGGANKGSVTVVKSDPKAECASNLATVSTASTTAKIKGFVMGLATNNSIAKTASGVRRLPTAVERREIEDLVRDEFIKQGVAGNTVEKMKYHNLTAIDVDNDGKAEMVGSFWTGDTAVERNLLFFIAEKQKNGKYAFGYSEFRKIIPNEVMSGEVKDLDDGVYHELLLDSMEYDGDNSAEIFTLVRGFEGSNFNVYSKREGKWTKVFEGSNYHCAY
ncbi:hypothetical protein BH20ACI4_BH20ACI4_25460 [soil metagenome]